MKTQPFKIKGSIHGRGPVPVLVPLFQSLPSAGVVKPWWRSVPKPVGGPDKRYKYLPHRYMCIYAYMHRYIYIYI